MDEHGPTHTQTSRLMSGNRVEAFSDGVFAIAITLLVRIDSPPCPARRTTQRLS